MNKDNRVKTIAGVSRFWDGSPISRTRAAAGESMMLYNRRLSIHLQMQPIIADDVLGDPLLMQQGLLARFLIAECDSLAGTRLYTGMDATQQIAVVRFHNQVSGLLSHKPEIDANGGLVLPYKGLSIAAKAHWVGEYNRTEQELGLGGNFELIKPFAAKAADNTLRLAGIFSIFETPGDVGDRVASDINLDQVQRAWRIMHYYMGIILRRTQLAEVKEVDRQVLEVMEWLKQRGGRTCIADMQKYLPRRQHRKSVDHIRAIMARLVAAKAVRVASHNTKGDPHVWEVVEP